MSFFGRNTKNKLSEDDTWEDIVFPSSDTGFSSNRWEDSKSLNEKTFGEQAKEKALDWKESAKQKTSEFSDKASDVAERMKPEQSKSLLERARESISETLGATKEKVQDVGYQLGLTSRPENIVDQNEVEEPYRVAVTVDDVVKIEKPEHLKGYTEVGYEVLSEKWEDTKGKARDTWEGAKELARDTWENTKEKARDDLEERKEKARKALEDTKEKVLDKWEGTKEKARDDLEVTKEKALDSWENTKEKAHEALEGTKEKVRDKWEGTKEKARDDLEVTKEKALDSWENTKEKARDDLEVAKEKTRDKWEDTKEKARENVDSVKGKVKEDLNLEEGKPLFETISETWQATKEKASDLVERIKIDDKPLPEKASETWEATKERAQDVGYQLGLTRPPSYYKENVKELGSSAADKISDTAQRMKPEDQKSYVEKGREALNDTWKSTKEKARDIGEKTTGDKQPVSQQVRENVESAKGNVKEVGSRAADKISDTAQRMKPEDQKSYVEKGREALNDTWESTKEKARDIGEKMTGDKQPVSQQVRENVESAKGNVKELGSRAADKISDTAQRMKPEDQKSYVEKGREALNDTWEATKEKARDIGEKMTGDKQPMSQQVRENVESAKGNVKEVGNRTANKISETTERMKAEEGKSPIIKTRDRMDDTWESQKRAYNMNEKMGVSERTRE